MPKVNARSDQSTEINASPQNHTPESERGFDGNDYKPKQQPSNEQSPPNGIQKEMRKLAKWELILMTTQSLSQAVMPQLKFTWGFLPVMWAIAYLSFLTLLSFQTYFTFADYFSHPVVVSISLEKADTAVEFPAITICNNNMVRKSAVSRISYLRDLALLDDYFNQLLRSEFSDIDPTIEGGYEPYDFEAYCDSLNGSFECTDAGFCITDDWVCNGFSECQDNSDETDRACKEYNRTKSNRTNSDNNISEDEDHICVDGFMKCPGELTCALACDTLIDCRVAKGYDETAEIGCVHACKRDVFVNGTVILTSPYFPENYKNDLECDYTLKAPEGHFIQIAFTSFDIEADFRCSYDYFMVFDSGSKSALRINGFRKICGSIDPNQLPVLNTTEEEARVIFETDGGVVAKGWNLTLEAIPIEVETGINRTKRSNSDWDSGFTSTPSSGWGDFWGDTSAAGWTMNTQDDQTTPTTTTTYDIYSGSSYHESYSTYFDYDYYYDTGDLFVDAASFDKITKNDWIEAVHLSNMPDFSDFKAFVKLSNAEIIGNGHQREAFIVQCVLDGKSCSHEIFTTIQDKDFGNCFSFNSFKQIKNEEPYSTTKTGFASGLKLTLFVDKDEYIGIFGQNSGARLTISNPRDFPPINTKALYLSAGFDTTLTLSQEWVIRAEHPFSNCTPSWPKHVEASKEAQMFTYTQDFCNALCQESTLSLVCNCSQISIFAFSANAEVSRNSRNYCDPWNKDQFKCVEDVLADFSMNKRMCDCPEPCQERSLKVTSSSSEWPTEAYAPYLAYLLRRSPSERVRKFIEYAVKATASSNSNPTLSEILRKNFVRVEIYFENMNYFKIEEMPKYNVSLLFGTLGGNMGLWLGWSIMALFELVQWIITCCSILLSKT